ncbi:hypothetical protein CGZ93_11500 [Enemella dayhoffiae]|uniref:Beta-lactamase-related domain-containing protein n=1 Tax=Enemella dayhoffiae TaxID=2016507 RepID=A0A255GZ00_9ACTN|nr:serine hydrolase domain-containing protein [Enemella dayhoffiae]OYO20847.1 hypothetical protein CGZ93_11500 [Enemella dayhoffiae]
MTQRSTNLPTASAEALGVRHEALQAFVDDLTARSVEVHGLAVVRRGHLVQLGEWAPWRAERPTLAYSVSKTVTASCVGLAIADGLFALDDRAADLLGMAPDAVAEGADRITVHHLLSMATGHTEDTLPALRWHGDAVAAFFGTPPQAEPGSVFCYNNGATWVLGELVRRHTGERLVDFATRRFLTPLGIDDLAWQAADGGELGFSGCFLTVEQIAAIAELYRCDGVWQGERLLPEGWAQLASAHQVATGEQENAHSRLGYGYQLWQHPDGYRLDGAFAQYGIVLPTQEAVIAVTSGQFPSQDVMEAVLAHLQPGLAPLEEPARPGAPGSFTAAVPWPGDGEPLEPVAVSRTIEPRQPQEAPEQWWFPELSEAELAYADGWQLRIRLTGEPTTVELGENEWLITDFVAEQGTRVPVATRARRSAGLTEVGLCFLDTPHRLTITLADDGTAVQRWNCPPLNGAPLAGLSAEHATVHPDPVRPS